MAEEATPRNGGPVAPGRRYGRLVVAELSGRDRHGNRLWKCRCDCGAEHAASAHNLKHGHTRSCGCLRREATGDRFRKPGRVARVLEAYRLTGDYKLAAGLVGLSRSHVCGIVAAARRRGEAA